MSETYSGLIAFKNIYNKGIAQKISKGDSYVNVL
jgi:hypothetical protein